MLRDASVTEGVVVPGQQPESAVVAIAADVRESRVSAETVRCEVDLVRRELDAMRALSLRLLDRMQTRCVTITPIGVISNCSDAFANLLKLSPQDLVGTSLLDCVIDAERSQFLAYCQQCLSTPMEVSFVVHLGRFRFPTLRVRLTMTRLGPAPNTQQVAPTELILMVTDASLQDSPLTDNARRGRTIPT